ncbi:MAG TPA: hypothetical protein VHK64_05815, partial [Nocardioidaceae bacterium]|nr:hypothetical protein [Nocardioidaceae bacterium]
MLSFLPVVSQAQTITFLDQGAPATVLLDGSTVKVRVVDPAADIGYRRDGVLVTVSSDRAGDSATFSLVETGTQTGVFEGAIDLEPGGSLGAATLATATSPAPPARDTIHASYSSATATANLVGSSIRFLNLWDQETASVVAGFSAQLRVRDELRNNSLSRDSLTVTLTSQAGGDSETVTLQETGVNTGVFEGAFTTTRTASTPGNGQLGVTTSDVITATLPDGDGLAATTVQVPTASRAVLLVDDASHPTGTLLEGAPVHVFVVDPGAGSVGSVTVQATTALSGDSETLTLTALGGIVFEGEIPTLLIAGATPPYSTPGDGTLQLNEVSGTTPQRDAVTVTYGTASASAGFVAGRITLVNDEGKAASSYLVGSEAHIRLELPSRNTSGLDQAPAMLVNEDTGAQTFLTLTEERRDSGVFVGSVLLSTSGSGSGDVLAVQLGDHIHAVYDAIASPSAEVVDTALTFLDEWGEPTDEIVEYGEARLRLHTVYDGYSPSPGSPNLINIEVRGLLTNDMEGLTLSETSLGTKVYEGSIPLEVSSYSSADDKIQTVNSGPPDYRQDTVTGRFNQIETSARTVGARLQFLDAFGRTTSAYAAGESIRLRIVDHFQTFYLRNSFDVTLVSLGWGDSETVTLQRSSPTSAIYEGTIPSSLYGARSANGSLAVDVLDQIEVRHVTGFSPIEISARAAIDSSSVVFLDAAGQPATAYLEGTRAYLRVVSAYHNSSPSSQETVQVQLLAELSQDTETLILTETGSNTGVFLGSIPLRMSFGSQQPGNGILETTELGGYNTPHEFDTLRATFIGGPGNPAVARIGMTGSRTWFANAAGAEVLSYPVGAKAYVRVEDHNLNDPGQWDRAYVQVSASNGDTEMLQLTETARDSGIFAGSIDLVSSTLPPASGTLSVAPGDQIEAAHQDGIGATASSAVADIGSLALEFIDATGAPTTELLERDDARVRMFSLLQNTNPAVADSVVIELRSLHSGDVEQVTLTETGADTSVFEGSIPTIVDIGYGGDGVLQTNSSGFPSYAADQITARFGSDQVTAQMAGARVRFVDADGREVARFVAGETVRMRVVDHNRNIAQNRDTLALTLYSRDGGDTEALTLQETGFNTAVFEGSLPSSFGGAGVGNGRLDVFPNDLARAEYQPSYSPHLIEAQADVTGNAVRFIDAAGQPAESYLESSRAYLRVVSALANGNPSAADTVQAQIVAELSADTETVTLTETGPSTGVFEGSIQLRLSYGGAYPGNGVLETTELGHPVYSPPHQMDSLRATYADAAGTSEALAGLTGSRTWFADAAGVEVQSYPAGGTVYVRVEDQNYNRLDQWDRAWVEVRSASGDFEPMELLETSRDSGVFAGSIELATDTPQSYNRRLYGAPGEQITVSHQDAFGATASTDAAVIESAAIEFIDAAGERTGELLEGGTARVRLFSLNNNANPGLADTATLVLMSQRANDEELVVLTETGPDTHVFEGSIQLTTGSYVQGDGLLGTSTSGFPEYLPEEVTARSGPVRATARVMGARVVFFDGYGRETRTFAAGETVRVRVIDHNRNTPQNRDSVQVPLTSRDGGDSELLTLQETGFNTAVFEGSVATRFGGTNTQGDGQLRVFPDDQVEASHLPAYSPVPLVAQAAVAGNALLFIDAAGQPAVSYLESSRAYVRVVSAYANQDAYVANQVTVQIVAELAADSEQLVLTETGPNTGVFEGSIPLRLSYGGAYPSNGILETVELGHPMYQPPHEFDTLRATYIDAAGTSVARIGLTGSRTWFADANGVEVLSYPAGGTAYVRVEDQNFNRPGDWDRVWTELSSSSGDHEYLELRETSRDSGVFAGSIELSRDTPQQANGRLYAAPGDQIEVTHQDATNATVSSAVADIEGGAIEFIDASGQPTVELLESGIARVRLFSVSSNSNPGGADTATLLVGTLRSGDEELVQLTETGFDTNVFEGSIQLTTGSYSQGDGLLGTSTSGFPEYLPEEVTARTGPIHATARVMGARITFFDGYGRETSSFAAGATVRVRVVDHNRNTPQNRESIQVPVASRDGGDSELLTLQETGFNTAVFEGSVPSRSNGPNTQGDAQLRVLPGDQLQADYVPAFSPNPLVAQAAVAGNAVLFVDAVGQPASTYLESS